MLASGFDGTLHVGVTSSLIGRIIQHRSEVFGGFTARHAVRLLVWYETVERMEDALASEKRIKHWPRDWKKNLIERENPGSHDLAVALGPPPAR